MKIVNMDKNEAVKLPKRYKATSLVAKNKPNKAMKTNTINAKCFSK